MPTARRPRADPMPTSPRAPSVVFFDLDGTLTDPKPGITGCIQYALERLGEPVPGQDALEWCIGPPLIDSFEKLVGVERAGQGVDLYRERFGDVGLFENQVYPGIPAALSSLLECDLRLFVASSKPKVYVDRILEHFDLVAYFEKSYGSNLDGTRTDKRELLWHALATERVVAAEAMMVGDRGADAVGALHNEMPFLGVLYGYGSRKELEQAGATRFAARPRDLVASRVEGRLRIRRARTR